MPTTCRLMIPAAILAVLLCGPPAAGGDLAADEEVLLFPTDAHLDPVSGQWVVPVHGWVFEPEPDSVWRTALVDDLLAWLELRRESVHEGVFRDRAGWFLADSERGKSLTIRVAGQETRTPPTGPDGHFELAVQVTAADAEAHRDEGWLPVRTDPAGIGGRSREGRVHMVPAEGLSVISDIDDTIKVSDVPDKAELLANTFLRPQRPVPGMARAYRAWEQDGAAFHYVSAAPWQLYQPLARFLGDAGFPAGSVRLRRFRIRDRTFFNLFASPEESKVPVIESLLETYPDRRFVLVGDSGEKDPEVYGEIARRRPEQVVRILIRDVPGGDGSRQRLEAAFTGVEAGLWATFRDGEDLPGRTP